MIPLFLADGKTRIPLLYNGLTFNQEVSDKKNGIFISNVRSATLIQAVQEAREFTDGMEVYPAYKRSRRILLDGEISSSTLGGLFDRIEAFAVAFDPALVSHNNPDTNGFLPLDFYVPTADTTNWPLVTYPNGIPCRYYVRAEAPFEPSATQLRGLSLDLIGYSLLAADPSRYLQSTSQLTGAGTADNTLADYYSYPTLTIAMTGAGNAAFAIGNSTVGKTLTLNLSGLVNGDSVAIDMQARKIMVNGVSHPTLYVSGDYFWIEPGSNTITVTNTTNASPTLTWRSAFVS